MEGDDKMRMRTKKQEQRCALCDDKITTGIYRFGYAIHVECVNQLLDAALAGYSVDEKVARWREKRMKRENGELRGRYDVVEDV